MEREENPDAASICPRCGRRFVCGAAAGRRECWCMSRPALPPGAADGGRCLCPECFDRLLGERASPEGIGALPQTPPGGMIPPGPPAT